MSDILKKILAIAAISTQYGFAASSNPKDDVTYTYVENAFSDDDEDEDCDVEEEISSVDEEQEENVKPKKSKKKKKNYFSGVYIGPDVSYGLLNTHNKINYTINYANGVSTNQILSNTEYDAGTFQTDIGGRIGMGYDFRNVFYVALDFTAHFVNGRIKRNGYTVMSTSTTSYQTEFKQSWRYNPSVQLGFNIGSRTIIYGIAGYEWASFKFNSNYGIGVNAKEILSGFVGGGGVGIGLFKRLSLRFETTKSFLDTFHVSKTVDGNQISISIEPREYSSNLSLLYRF